jgi:lipopolysaccharide export system permease protein
MALHYNSPVRLLSRYLLRQLVAPFCFALAALTSLMLLNQIAKKFGSLVGKGLPWSVVADVFVLSLPFILAMTMPMAVLLAVLYAFSHLAADNEVTALRASGVSVPQLLRPVLAWGVLMAAVTFAFVDQVLPRSNAELRGLLIDIGRKRPTFELREQVINDVPPSKYFLRAGRIDPGTGRLRGVTIYDVNDDAARRVIYADSGFMAYAPGGRDLSLSLYHGTVHQYRPAEPDRFHVTRFERNEIRVRDVFDELERNTADNIRGDRELSSCEMLDVVRDADREKARADRDRRQLLRRDMRELLALPPTSDTLAPAPVADDYCVWVDRVRAKLMPIGAAAEQPSAAQGRQGTPPAAKPPAGKPPAAPPAGMPPAAHTVQDPRLTVWADVALTADRWKDADLRADRYMVEVHKKWAISTACISFVLLGIALALRFPRGGMGLVIGGGLAAFSLYYVGLTAGETLADRGLLSPLLAMWLPNMILTLVGIAGLVRVNRQPGLNRGGDFRELFDAVRWRLRRRKPA